MDQYQVFGLAEAVKYFDKAIEIDPDYADAWEYKGNALDILGRSPEAAICYGKASELHAAQKRPDQKNNLDHKNPEIPK
jgi:Flp pilus assembly protein TadD